MDELVGYCTLCRSRCGALHHIEDGKLAKVTPLASHPTGGALCAKGRAAPELAASPLRLGRPLKRTRARTDADPGWVEISWAQALDEMARRLAAIRAEDGAEAVAFAVTTPSGTPMVDSFEWVERFVRCFGSPNLIYAVEVCGWHKDYAHALTFGRGIGIPDWDHTDVIVMWGHNPARTWLAQAAHLAEARRRGAQVVVVDPKQDGTGQQADLWLRIRPGADGALAMGAIRHLIESVRYDADFVRRWTNAPMLVDVATQRLLRAGEIWAYASADAYVVVDARGHAHPYDTRRPLAEPLANPQGVALRADLTVRDLQGRPRRCATVFELLARQAAPYTTAHVARLTWIEPEQIERFNRLYEGGPRLSYHAWTGVGQHTNATLTERAMATLYALSGACDRQGGNIWTVGPPTNPVNGYRQLLSAAQRAKALGLDDLPLGPPAHGWITARDFCAAVLEKKPYPVKALISFGSNLLVSQADSARNRRALQALDFHVHVDAFMNPSAQNADLVLPASMPWEREALKIGFEISQAAAEHVQLRQRMLAPFAAARADYEIVFDLATRLGLGEQFFGGSIEAGWDYQLAPLGISAAQLRAEPQGMRFAQAFAYRKYARPAPTGEGGEGGNVGDVEEGGEVAGFSTPSRRVELYSEPMADIGQPPLAAFAEPAESPLRAGSDPAFPLVLTTAKSGWYVHSSHRHVASLRQKAADPSVQIGAGLAQARSICAGDWTHVRTPRGAVVLRAKIDATLDDRTVIADFGWWQGCDALGRDDAPLLGELSSNTNGILSDCHRDPVSGSVPLRATLCDIRRHETMNHGRWHGRRAFRLAARSELAQRIVGFEFTPLDGGPIAAFLPGQHITVSLSAGNSARAYSLTGHGKRARALHIAVKRDGKMSTLLHGLAVGQTVELGPPGGSFTIPTRSARPIVLMASGIGITPFIGYLEALNARAPGTTVPQVTLFYVCRNKSAHAFGARLKELQACLPGVRVVTYYRAPGPEDRLGVDYERLGDLDVEALDRELLARRPLAYLCGSARFLDMARSGLVRQGMPAFDVLSETFSTRIEVPPASRAQPVTLCGTGERFIWDSRAGTLLDAADAAGVALPSGCRVGQCESCLVQVISGQVAHLSPYDGPADACLTCQAIPLTPVELKR